MTASPMTAHPKTVDPKTADPKTAGPLTAPPLRHLRVVVRAAPLREPPFDDEVAEAPVAGSHDQRLPFDTSRQPRVRPVAVLRPNGLPDPCVWGRRLLIGLVESADGRRPLHQLSSLLSLSVNRGLYLEFERAATSRQNHWLRQGTVRSIRGCEPADGVAELSATIDTGRRVRAVALRLEERRGRWCCTRLQLG